MKKYYFIALISTILALSGCEQHRFQDIDTDYRSGWIIYLDANGGNFSDLWDNQTAPSVKIISRANRDSVPIQIIIIIDIIYGCYHDWSCLIIP